MLLDVGSTPTDSIGTRNAQHLMNKGVERFDFGFDHNRPQKTNSSMKGN